MHSSLLGKLAFMTPKWQETETLMFGRAWEAKEDTWGHYSIDPVGFRSTKTHKAIL